MRRRRRRNPDVNLLAWGLGLAAVVGGIFYAVKTSAAMHSVPTSSPKNGPLPPGSSVPVTNVSTLPTAKRPADLPPPGFPENQGVITVASGTVFLEPDGGTSSLTDDTSSDNLIALGFIAGSMFAIPGVSGEYTLLSDGTVSFDPQVET